MEITKDTIRDLFMNMHLSKVTIGETLRRSKRLAEKKSLKQLQLIQDTPIDKINNEDILEQEPSSYPTQIPLYTPQPISEDLFKTPVKHSSTIDYPLTTISRALYNGISPINKAHYLDLLRRDDQVIRRTIRDVEDTPYNEIDGSEMGVYIESWVCANLFCPGCQEYTLYKYSHPNMPVVDVACVNPSHVLSHGPRYYQIKATQNTGPNKYFTRTPISHSPTGYIKVGSKRYGKFSHEVLVTDESDKDLVVGYICISYTQKGDMRITINPDESFILIPNLIARQNPQATHHAYYKYLYTRNSVVVCYNYFYMMPFSLREYFQLVDLDLTLLNNININYRFEYDEGEITISQVLNPTQTTDASGASAYPQTPLRSVEPPAKKRSAFYNKYLKYKTKYINLKLSNLHID